MTYFEGENEYLNNSMRSNQIDFKEIKSAARVETLELE
jgi:hypothetical protein